MTVTSSELMISPLQVDPEVRLRNIHTSSCSVIIIKLWLSLSNIELTCLSTTLRRVSFPTTLRQNLLNKALFDLQTVMMMNARCQRVPSDDAAPVALLQSHTRRGICQTVDKRRRRKTASAPLETFMTTFRGIPRIVCHLEATRMIESVLLVKNLLLHAKAVCRQGRGVLQRVFQSR
jgi:hypothetical protein